jgi:hypothetical protein
MRHLIALTVVGLACWLLATLAAREDLRPRHDEPAPPIPRSFRLRCGEVWDQRPEHPPELRCGGDGWRREGAGVRGAGPTPGVRP